VAAVGFAVQGSVVTSSEVPGLDVEVRLPVLLGFPDGEEGLGFLGGEESAEGFDGGVDLGDLHWV